MRMKKLLMFLVLLTVSVGTWAAVSVTQIQANDVNGKGYTYEQNGYAITTENAGELATAVSNSTISDMTNGTYFTFSGPLNANDLKALSQFGANSSNDVYFDFSNATFVDGDNNELEDTSILKDNLTNTKVNYLVLPNATTSITESDFPSSVKEALAINGNKLFGYSSSTGGALEHVLAFDKRYASEGNTVTDYTLVGTYTYIQDPSTTGSNARGAATYSTTGLHNSVFGVIKRVGDSGYSYANIVNLDLSGATFPNYSDEAKTYQATEGLSTWTGPTNGMELIHEYANSLTSIKLPETEGTTLIPYQALYNCTHVTALEIPGNIETLGMECFYSVTSATSITFNVGLKHMAPDVFLNCSSVTSIALPVGLEEIGEYAFIKCSSLDELIIPEGVKVIKAGAFEQTAIKSVRLPHTLKSIEKNAFRQCLQLQTMTFPENLEYIGEDAFKLCYGLTDVYFLGTTTIPEVHENAFDKECYANNGGLASGGETDTNIQHTYGDYSTALIDSNTGIKKKVDLSSWVDYDANGVKVGGATVMHYPLVKTEAEYASFSSVSDYITANAAEEVELYYHDGTDYVKLVGTPLDNVDYYKRAQNAETTQTSSPVEGISHYYSDPEGNNPTLPQLSQDYYYACGEVDDYDHIDYNSSLDAHSQYYVYNSTSGEYEESDVYFSGTKYWYSETETTGTRYVNVNWSWWNSIKSNAPFYTLNNGDYELCLPTFNNTTAYYYDENHVLQQTNGIVELNGNIVLDYYDQSGVQQDFQLNDNNGKGYYYKEEYSTHYVPSNIYIPNKTWYNYNNGSYEPATVNWYTVDDNSKYYFKKDTKKTVYCTTRDYIAGTTYYTDANGTTEATNLYFNPAVYYYGSSSFENATPNDVATATYQNTTLYTKEGDTYTAVDASNVTAGGTYYIQTSAANDDVYGEYYTDPGRNANYGGIYRGSEEDGYDLTHGLTTWPTYWDFGIWTYNGQQFPRTGLSTPDDVNRDGLKNFILVAGYPVEPTHDTPVVPVEHMDKDVWYTMCFPFDLTDKQLEDCFGIGYELAQFTDVSIENGKYRLNFTTAIEADADGIMTHKHVPYMIHPNAQSFTLDDNGELVMTTTKFVLTDVIQTEDDYNMSPADMLTNAITATDPNGKVFTFVGYGHNYAMSETAQVVTPQYSFFLGTAAGETYPKYWRQTAANTRMTGSAWKKNTAIVLPPNSTLTYKDNRIIYDATGTALDYVSGEDSYSYINYVCPEYTVSAVGGSVKSMDIFFTNEPFIPNAINDIIEKETEKDSQIPAAYKNKIFNMSGQMVGTSPEGLEKGIYIMNGKKFIVR